MRSSAFIPLAPLVVALMFLGGDAGAQPNRNVPQCSSRVDYFRTRFLECMRRDSRGRTYCESWMGCAGAIYINPQYGTITGTTGSSGRRPQ